MSALRLLWLLSLSTAVLPTGRHSSGSDGVGSLLYEKPGNVSLKGVFGPIGRECSVEVGRGLEEIISTIWTIEALNAYQYLPGITIGLSILDACETSNDTTSGFKMAEEHSGEEAVNVGILTTRETFENLERLESLPDVVSIKHIITEDVLADITVQLLTNLQWTNVSTLFVDSDLAMKSFEEKASQEGISVRDSVLVNSSDPGHGLESFTEKVQTAIVVIASFPNIARLAHEFQGGNGKLILAPTDFVFELSLSDLPKDTIVCLPSMQDKRTLSGQLKNIASRKDFFTRKPPVRGPLFLGTAATILSFLRPLRTALEDICPNENPSSQQPCVPALDFIRKIKANKTSLLSHETTEISPDDVEEALKVLKIEPSSNDEMFLCIASVINTNVSEDFAIFQLFNLELKTFRPVLIMINDGWRTGEPSHVKPRKKDPAASLLQENPQPPPEETPPAKGCDSGNCGSHQGNITTNVTEDDVPQVSWRYLTWVSVNTSVGFVGITCTLSIMLFMAIKVCRDEFLDGSPQFTLLLMVSVVLTYLSSIPFHLEFLEGGFMCGYRKWVPPVVFSVLFSLLLSRSVMVAFREAVGGLSGHLNGYLQSILCVFMIGVQVSVTTQNWIFSGRHDLTCADAYDKYNLIVSLGYDFLLLILLACVSPFIVRSKRNCKEGLLFSISVFFITILWSAWVSFYVLLPNEHKDAAVAVGLNSTASVLLLCVFIPQMYFMAAPFPRDQTLPALSSLDRHVLSGGSHPDFKSSHALNDCAFGSYRNCDMGCSNPGFLARPNGGSHPGTNDNFVGEGDVTPEASQPN